MALDNNLQKLQRLLSLMDEDALTKEEFIKNFKTVIDAVIKARDMQFKIINDAVSRLEDKYNNNTKSLEDNNTKTLEQIKNDTLNKLDKALKEQQNGMNFIYDKVSKLRSGKDADEDKIIKKILKQIPTPKDGKDAVVDYNEIIDSITGPIEDKLKDIESQIGKTKRGRVMTPRYVHTPMVDDFSGSTDGATKEFTLSKAPKSTTTMKVWGSDFPHILRPTTDFTVAGKVLTLTSEVDAPSSGATLICEFYV